jgi:hypothetical protein
MDEHDNFEDRLRAMADEISRSLQRMSEVDLEDLAERYGIDVDRARTFADAAGKWLSDRLAGGEPFFDPSRPGTRERSASGPAPRPEEATPHPGIEKPPPGPGPHPLDLPNGPQGLALSALDSGRWTVRPGSNQLAGTGEGPPPPAAAPDLVGDLRARDWITVEGTLTQVGRHALARWCRAAGDPVPETASEQSTPSS